MIKLAENAMLSRLDEETVLLDTARGVYYGLNETGAVMLDLVLEKGSTSGLAPILAKRFDAPEERIGADLERLLADLLKAGLVRDVPGG